MLEDIQPAEVRNSLAAWHDGLKTRALKVLTEDFPAQILRLNGEISKMRSDSTHTLHATQLEMMQTLPLIDTSKSSIDSVEESGPASKKRKRDAAANGALETNGSGVKFTEATGLPPQICKALEMLRTEWETLVELSDSVKLYITLQLPKAEDGNNSGVQTAEDCAGEIVRAQDLGVTLLECTYKYALARAKLSSKLLKYPNSGEYQTAIREGDRNQFFLCRQRLLDLRNLYAGCMDMCLKNLAKVKQPRSEFAGDMF